MLLALFLVVVISGAIALTTWTIRSLLRYSCRECGEERSSLIPVVPGLRWYCFGCDKILSGEDLHDSKKNNSSPA